MYLFCLWSPASCCLQLPKAKEGRLQAAPSSSLAPSTLVVRDSHQGLFLAGHLDVTMAATNLENQLHSAQKNLLFLQREHASTLKGLHAEIRRLQQHCTGTRAPHDLLSRASRLAGAVEQSRARCRDCLTQQLAQELCQTHLEVE